MIELEGKYNSAKVFTDVVDSSTIGQIIALLNQESVKDSTVRIMPDTHAGKGCVIGATMTIKDKVIPNLVGVDIGCSVRVVQLKSKSNKLSKLDELLRLDSVIRKEVPSGFNIRTEEHRNCANLRLEEPRCKKAVNLDRAYKSLGTLGGGNHFIEIDQDDDGNKYLIIHTGSRHLGAQVAKYYQDQAYKALNSGNVSEIIKDTINELKAQGRQLEINDAIAKIRKDNHCDVPYELAYCEGQLFNDYIHDMKIVQQFAVWNRQTIQDVILAAMKWKAVDTFETIHNYIDTDNMILRKGAVSARLNEKLIIPINMRDGSLICIGKGNDDWNQSAPHGAGRVLSRNEAKNKITLSEFKKSMQGIFTTSVSKSTIDESPMAYKNMEDIISNIGDTVDILKVIKPVYNFKAGEE